MKGFLKYILLLSILMGARELSAQNEKISTVFHSRLHSSGGYGAVTNKFTKIRGSYANIVSLYGGWFINHRLMIGLEGASVTNSIHVPLQFCSDPTRNMNYEYGQAGLAMDYVLFSSKPVHLAFHLFAGAGFTLQYESFKNAGHDRDETTNDENWFVVTEPGIQLEVNLFKWMRLSPGISYRSAFGSDGKGVGDKDLSNISYNATLKFGRF